MPIIILFIVLTVIGGPWFVAVALTLTAGFWKTMAWIVIVIVIGAMVICIGFAVALLVAWLQDYSGVKSKRKAFGAPLTASFKQSHGVENGIWMLNGCYMVEHDQRTFYFESLAAARSARDTGIPGYAASVPIRPPQ